MESRRPGTGVDVLGSGTALRFVLLVVLVAASTVVMAPAHPALSPLVADLRNGTYGCLFAAGFDPSGPSSTNSAAMFGRNSPALTACLRPFSIGWLPFVAVGAVFVLAAALCWVMPEWKIRRRGLRPVDPVSETGAALGELAARACVRSPRFLADWASGSVNAVAFGRPGRAWISLPGGLLATRTSDPDRFAAVVLHELAHLRHRDVGITYATIAIWRVFAFAVLVPFLVVSVLELVVSQFFLTGAFEEVILANSGQDYARSVLVYAFMAALVYLLRSDILRTREYYADRRAVDWGASRTVWDAGRVSAARHGRIAAVTSALAAVHPSWARRGQALRDPEVLFRLPPLPTFLTGAAAAMIAGQLQWLSSLPAPPIGFGTVLAGALVAGTTWLTIWRRTAFAAVTGRATPSALGAGFWLGGGVAAGSQAVGSSLFEWNQLVPLDSWNVLLIWIIAWALTGWTAQCARVLTATMPRRCVRISASAGLIGAAAVLAAWLNWWLGKVNLLQSEIIAALWDQTGPLLGIDPGTSPWLAGFAVAVLASSLLDPWMIWSTTALWVVPAIAWFGPGAGSWLVRNGLPPFRMSFGVGALAGALPVVLLVVGVLRPPGGVDAAGRVSVIAGLSAVLMAVCLAASLCAAAMVVAFGAQRTRMVTGAVVAGIALVAACTSLVLVVLAPGCVLPASSSATCQGFGSHEWLMALEVVKMLLGAGAITAVAGAFVVAALAGLVRPEPALDGGDLVRARPAALATRRVAVAVLLLLSAVGATASTLPVPGPSAPFSSPTAAQTAPVPTSSQVRQAQAVSWVQHGGAALLAGWSNAMIPASNGLAMIASGRPEGADAVRAGCTAITRWASDANAYFAVPDPEQQARWEQVQAVASNAGPECVAALNRGDLAAVEAAYLRLYDTFELVTAITDWLYAMSR